MNLQALIFDVDGTLAETERDGHRPAFNAAFDELGLQWHWDEKLYGELLRITGGKERMRHYAALHDPAFLMGPYASQGIQRLHAAKTRHYLQRVAAGLPLRPGIAEILALARHSGLRLAIATTTSPENVHELLVNTLGAESLAWFEVIGAGDVVAAKKPAPDIYQWVLQGLDLPAAAALAIEDSAPGLLAARAAGIATLVTPSDYTRDHDFAGASACLQNLAGISLADLQRIHGCRSN
ncbi:MAG TPA: HAD-IA family hydrolase [Rhodocyclaceae bacterium]